MIASSQRYQVPARRTPLPAWAIARRRLLGERIAATRKEQHISQDQLADRIGRERRSIQRYESGEDTRGTPTSSSSHTHWRCQSRPSYKSDPGRRQPAGVKRTRSYRCQPEGPRRVIGANCAPLAHLPRDSRDIADEQACVFRG
ncbi:helix-turn-helix transcriptional regulator [Streptomyces sp. NPDC097617]|uniref:helix-turn-helix transcriptional regulator n=1 Tax=Streptomyces sp. NPDC097617 TaxID=3366091 RepID=UPI0038041AB9